MCLVPCRQLQPIYDTNYTLRDGQTPVKALCKYKTPCRCESQSVFFDRFTLAVKKQKQHWSIFPNFLYNEYVFNGQKCKASQKKV